MRKNYIQPASEVMAVRFIDMICDTSAYVPVSEKSFDQEDQVF